MTLEQILPEIRKGRRARRKGNDLFWFHLGWLDIGMNMSGEDLLADDWELEPESGELRIDYIPRY